MYDEEKPYYSFVHITCKKKMICLLLKPLILMIKDMCPYTVILYNNNKQHNTKTIIFVLFICKGVDCWHGFI